MDRLEERFIELWNSGAKYAEIEYKLNMDGNAVSYMRRKLGLKPRQDNEARRALRDEVFAMVQERIPIADIMRLKGVSRMYVYHTINKRGHYVREFYDKPIKEYIAEAQREDKKGVNCTEKTISKCVYGSNDCCMYCVMEKHRRPCPPDECTCYIPRPKGFKQRSWTFV